MINKIESFTEIAPKVFESLVNGYGYTLDEIKTTKHNGNEWSVHLIYINQIKGLTIVIKQEPYYTDYGFSFAIEKTGTEMVNILYHVEHHLQDERNQFLLKAAEDLFSNPITRDMISGKNWEVLGYIPFQVA